MGLFKKIGRSFKKAARKVGKTVSKVKKVGKAVSKVTGTIKKIANIADRATGGALGKFARSTPLGRAALTGFNIVDTGARIAAGKANWKDLATSVAKSNIPHYSKLAKAAKIGKGIYKGAKKGGVKGALTATGKSALASTAAGKKASKAYGRGKAVYTTGKSIEKAVKSKKPKYSAKQLARLKKFR